MNPNESVQQLWERIKEKEKDFESTKLLTKENGIFINDGRATISNYFDSIEDQATINLQISSSAQFQPIATPLKIKVKILTGEEASNEIKQEGSVLDLKFFVCNQESIQLERFL